MAFAEAQQNQSRGCSPKRPIRPDWGLWRAARQFEREFGSDRIHDFLRNMPLIEFAPRARLNLGLFLKPWRLNRNNTNRHAAHSRPVREYSVTCCHVIAWHQVVLTVMEATGSAPETHGIRAIMMGVRKAQHN